MRNRFFYDLLQNHFTSIIHHDRVDKCITVEYDQIVGDLHFVLPNTYRSWGGKLQARLFATKQLSTSSSSSSNRSNFHSRKTRKKYGHHLCSNNINMAVVSWLVLWLEIKRLGIKNRFLPDQFNLKKARKEDETKTPFKVTALDYRVHQNIKH